MVKEHEVYLQKIQEAQKIVFCTTDKHLRRGNRESISSLKKVLKKVKETMDICLSLLNDGIRIRASGIYLLHYRGKKKPTFGLIFVVFIL